MSPESDKLSLGKFLQKWISSGSHIRTIDEIFAEVDTSYKDLVDTACHNLHLINMQIGADFVVLKPPTTKSVNLSHPNLYKNTHQKPTVSEHISRYGDPFYRGEMQHEMPARPARLGGADDFQENIGKTMIDKITNRI